MDRISIATINFNGAEKTIILLDSLKNQSVKDFQMIVVDNNSDKYDYARLENWILNNSPDVFLFKNAVNSGFAGGSNYGINKALKAGADWVVLLNNDTWVESDFIERLKPELEHKEGIIGLPLDEGDGHISFGGCLQWLKPTLTHGHGYVKGEKTTKVNFKYAIGGGMAVSKDVFRKIGVFDENYFLYFEDADFSFRAWKANVPIEYLRLPIVKHAQSSSAAKLGSPTLLRLHYRNALYFNMKHGPVWVQFMLLPWSWLILTKQAIKIVFNYHVEESKAIIKGVLDFYYQRYGKI
ncbi:MAG: Glycosyl transferase family 2 [Candidatus Yanofskybacteria bacterium GW2011_GWA1_44_21]|uniref:Glycosyltransferase 2-like domain-containing protein n=2 Tax=Candidatus Yanofskyibacteriota TaxID=1752733 RepID=A0A1F8GZI8_9BACT|nr:MAG: Glycosyl transferase family 2 [Candidatus Yanofskybacteria bacterium GW2011_GWA1_44_21]KKT90289.1 MAG: Glycosyl transferase family 2 [Candidatus Yanofskybacteria bacterium GW2011_GWB1_45_11]OGN03057.1 MAG: hypothetical protein A2657_00730 [Candidatus Yanofskybacteria bacterium RIFCSPHIGHO2_01_FULL_44_110b]OGN14555.1 MAG: hypothetical protein A3C01_00505 [Candidatus Yanofskybacteria bacterium RIFCSPHIGHO2_02_FULL_44_36b]OGN18228.1 MAG: hypothetical protein A3F50_02560 [Candidatus Yanofsk